MNGLPCAGRIEGIQASLLIHRHLSGTISSGCYVCGGCFLQQRAKSVKKALNGQFCFAAMHSCLKELSS